MNMHTHIVYKIHTSIYIRRVMSATRAQIFRAFRKSCNGCGRNHLLGDDMLPSKARQCACQSVRYCGRECQQAQWRGHRDDCVRIRHSWIEEEEHEQRYREEAMNLEQKEDYDQTMPDLVDPDEPDEDDGSMWISERALRSGDTGGLTMEQVDAVLSTYINITAPEGLMRTIHLADDTLYYWPPPEPVVIEVD